MFRKLGLFLPLVWIPWSFANAQVLAPQNPDGVNGIHHFTLIAGLGNDMGGFGVQGEKYFRQGRFSVFSGFGYTPEDDRYPGGPAVAAGVRGFTAGTNHRAFLEISISQMTTVSFDAHPPDGQKVYGPGLQAGYHHTAGGGFTFMVSVGAGYGIGTEFLNPVYKDPDSVHVLGGLGLGYSWN